MAIGARRPRPDRRGLKFRGVDGNIRSLVNGFEGGSSSLGRGVFRLEASGARFQGRSRCDHGGFGVDRKARRLINASLAPARRRASPGAGAFSVSNDRLQITEGNEGNQAGVVRKEPRMDTNVHEFDRERIGVSARKPRSLLGELEKGAV